MSIVSTNSPTSPRDPIDLPHRSNTSEAIPDEDSSETAKLFHERLQAWKHATAYLEDYVEATEKAERSASKDYEKVLKAVNSPLKEGHHFDQNTGGVASLFDNIRSNTQAISTSHEETCKALKGSVLPIFERLHQDIKNKQKDLDKSVGKGSKSVDKARNDSQKHIDLLAQHSAGFDSQRGSVKSSEDPYLIQRGVYHRLHKQVIEENNNRDDMIAVQNEFAQFEAGMLRNMQQGMQQFNQVMAHQADQQRTYYGDMAATSSQINPDFEWNGFVKRNSHILINPDSPKRSLENISFPNQDHPSTRPLIAGSLERKGKLLKSYDAGYYVVTPSKYLHEFKSDDDFGKDPSPENSLYLPDCLIGAVEGSNFVIKGKDTSKGAFNKMSMSRDYTFRAHTSSDARKWHDIIQSVSGGTTNSAPSSPVVANEEASSPHSVGGTPVTAGGNTAEKDLAGNPVIHSEKDASSPTYSSNNPYTTSTTSPTSPSATGPTGGSTESAKANDYAPL